MENSDKSMLTVDAVANAEINVNDGKQKKEVRLLTAGLVNLCQKDLEQVQNCLKEVLTKQDKLSIDLLHMNEELSIETRVDCQQMFSSVKEYTDRLHVIRKQMTGIHQRVKHLKKRVNELENFVARKSSALRQRQLNEEALIAKATTSTQNK